MRQLQRFCAATLMSLAIGITAFGGDVQAPAGANPDPPVPVVVTTPAPGTVTPAPGSPADILAQLALELARLLSTI